MAAGLLLAAGAALAEPARPPAVAIPAPAPDAVLPMPVALDIYRWKQRPLLIVAPRDDAAVAEQRRRVAAAAAEIRARDMAVVWVIGDSVSADFGAAPKDSAASLRARAGGGDEARMVLIGKDGGVKERYRLPADLIAVFRAIDAMPMRREEMQRRS
jgi:hypothetical protein